MQKTCHLLSASAADRVIGNDQGGHGGQEGYAWPLRQATHQNIRQRRLGLLDSFRRFFLDFCKQSAR